MSFRPLKIPLVRGFTLMELMVSLVVMTVISTTLIYKYPETSVRLKLSNVNQDIALLLREAQIKGSAVDSANGVYAGAGAYFNIATPTQAMLFGDAVDATIAMPNGLPVGDGLFTPYIDFGAGGVLSEIRATTTFPTGYVVSKLCVGSSFPFTCNEDGLLLPIPIPQITTLTISFMRPNPQPHIYINDATTTDYSGACIEVRSPNAPPPGQELPSGHIRSVQIFSSGSIRTFKGRCDNHF
jgi:prepilin-type N-terminal cleavage/methylation domain-containing protein